jgi:DNA-binding beta-propeller fold protein YncE
MGYRCCERRLRGRLNVNNAIKREETMKPFLRLLALSVATGTLLAPAGNARAQLLITGNDEKVSFDETGKTVTHPPGKDTVSTDIREPTKPRIIANLPLMNTIAGPPVNLAITPDQHLALVANSLDWVKDGENWKGVPDNKIYVIDLTTSPPAQIATVEAGKQPSGMAINRAGTLALVANRADDTVNVLSINGKTVKLVDTVSVASPAASSGTQTAVPALPSAVAITPDGKRALVVKSGANRVAVLDIDGQKVSYTKVDGKNYDMASGLNPINVEITPDGKLAIVNNIGGGQDGQVDTVAVINLQAEPPRVIDQVVVGDGPEGLAMSPVGGYAASIILNGTGGTPKTAFYRHEHSYASLLKIEGKTVRNVGQLAVGDLAEGDAFSPDGRFLFVGNFVDGNMNILRRDGDALTMVGSFALPGHPASMRGSTP